MTSSIRIVTAILVYALVAPTRLLASEPFDFHASAESVMASRCANVREIVEPAALAGDARATMLLAVMYDRGCGVAEDMPHAERLFEGLVRAGSTDPMARGFIALFGRDSALDNAQGISLLEASHRTGNPFAARMLAAFYRVGTAERSDLAKSAHWDDVATDEGDMQATAIRARDDILGVGVPVDIVKGKALLQRALDAGDSNAYETLGDVSLAGAAGFDTDRDRAFGLLRKALSLGDTFAKVEIAIGLRPADFGRRITQAEAASFMRTGTAAMLPRRYYSLVLGDFEIGIHGNTPDYADAVPRLKTGLVFKDVHTDENLAFCYLNGLGVTKDPEQAKKYLKAAVAEGSSWATSELADMSDDRSARSALNANQQASDYEGYHWSELHPMTQMPQPGSPADPNPH